MVSWLILNCFLFCLFPQQQNKEQKQETAPGPAPVVERSQREVSFYPGGKLEIAMGVPGGLKIIGWKRGSVLVEIERTIRGMDEDKAKALATQFPVQMRWTQTIGTIRTVGPPPGTVDMSVSLTVYVPKDKTDLNIQSIQGNLAIGGINGWIEASLQDGSIEAKSVTGYYSLTTKKGDMTFEMSGKRYEGYGLTGVTQKGNIEIRLPAEYSAALQLETRAGELSVDYPEQLVEGESVPLQATAKNAARALSATVGAGGAPIRLMTAAGNIELKKAQIP